MTEQRTTEPKVYANGDQMAFPVQESDVPNSLYAEKGLSKRELIAAMALQGLLSNLSALRRDGFRDVDISELAVWSAEALLKRLEP